MNKEFLLRRIQDHDKNLDEINKLIQKKMADLNVIIGQKNECLLIISELDKLKVVNEEPYTLNDIKKMTGAQEISVIENGKIL